MRVLVKKLKLKRFVAMLLLVCTVMSTFITSISTVDTVADSNDRRSTYINLAKGKSLSAISDASNLDTDSLRAIALYLSNFYVPWSTKLDMESIDSTSEFYKSMKETLTQKVGVESDTADFLVQATLNSTLSTAHELYMKKSTFEAYAKLAGEDTIGSVESKDWDVVNKGGAWGLFGDDTSSLFSFGGSLKFNGTNYRYKSYVECYNSSSSLNTSILGPVISNYENKIGTTTANVNGTSTSMIKVSYATFISIMAWCYDYAFAVMNTKAGAKDACGLAEFYWIDSNNDAHAVFDNSQECFWAYVLGADRLNYNSGYGSSILCMSDDEFGNLSGSDAKFKATSFGAQIYVDWVGDLIVDNGLDRYVLLPGAVNPYSFSSIDGTAGDSMNFINTYALSRANTSSSSGTAYLGKVSDSNYYLYYYVGARSLFNLGLWREYLGDDETALDYSTDKNLLSWLKSSEVDWVDVNKDGGSKDPMTFPNWGISTYLSYDTSSNYIRCDLYSSNPKDAVVSSSFTPYLQTDSSKSKIWSRKTTKFNTSILTYDNLSGYTDGQSLSDYFVESDIIEDYSKLSGLATNFSNVSSLGQVQTYSSATKPFLQSLFLTYAFAYFNKDSSSFDKSTNVIDLKFNADCFPSDTSELDFSSFTTSSLDDQIKSFVYYILHPTEGVSYVATLLKNKVGGFLLKWHEDIVGSSDSNSSTGMTKYLGTSSYTTTPGLYDVEWIASILSYYNTIIVYMIIFMCLVLLCYILTGQLTIQRGVVGLIIFSICAFLPPIAINLTSDTINTVSTKMYSDKFDYWAICQLQTYLINIEDAKTARSDEDMTTYAAYLIANQDAISSGDIESTTFYSGVKLKWMSPKKYYTTAMLSKALDEDITTDASFLKSLVVSSINVTSSAETYLDSDNALYLYRDYADIYRYSAAAYNVMSTYNLNGDLLLAVGDKTAAYIPLVMRCDSYYNTVKSAWSSHCQIYNKSTSTADSRTTHTAFENSCSLKNLYNSVLANTNSTTYTASLETSSLSQIAKGFMLDTVKYTDSSSPNTTYYWYDASNGYRSSTLATSYLMQYNRTIKNIHLQYNTLLEVANSNKSVNMVLSSNSDNVGYYYNFGLPLSSYYYNVQSIEGLADTSYSTGNASNYQNYFSDFYYGLYCESPFYFFNFNIRDQVQAVSDSNSDLNTVYNGTYNFNADSPSASGSNPYNSENRNTVIKLFLADNQSYFYNLSDSAGGGYGELRDFTNMHDFFYYIIPALTDGVNLARLYDDLFGLYADDDCSLVISNYNEFSYNGNSYTSLSDFASSTVYANMTDEDKYKFWHTYNTYQIYAAYSTWLDTMMDCDYAESETISIMGDKFIVSNPLDPYSYFTADDNGDVIAGRYMIFSQSELAYYGLNESDLTTVEKKILEFQDNVYSKAIDLTNYYTLSDEVLIQAYAMLQLFEFNTEFSQTGLFSEDYIMYPQGYELKATSYDAYLRMILAEASGEDLMTSDDTNSSIYTRIQENTSLFFSIALLINDVLAVYLIPGLKLFFIVCIFFVSILLLIGACIKLEFNIIKVMWQSILAPLLSFGGVSIAFSWLISLFMSDGASSVYSSSMTINLGDPTSTLLVMIIINGGVTLLFFKICKKCFHDLKTYFKAVFDNIGAAVVGAVGTVAATAASGSARERLMGKVTGGSSSGGRSSAASTAKQRGQDNMPTSGKNGLGVGSALAAGAGVGAAAGIMSKTQEEQLKKANDRQDASRGMNKYDKKAFDAANAKSDKYADKKARLDKLAGNAKDGSFKKKRLENASAKTKYKMDRQAQHADNISKYGRLRAGVKEIGYTKTHVNKSIGKAEGRLINMKNSAVLGASNAARGAKNFASNPTGALSSAGTAVKRGVRNAGNNIKKGVSNATSNARKDLNTNTSASSIRASARSSTVNRKKSKAVSALSSRNSSATKKSIARHVKK